MNSSGREIEAKYTIDAPSLGWTLDILGKRVESLPFLLINRSIHDCFTQDFYFPAHKSVSNIRLRDSYGIDNNGFSKQLKEITVKSKDQGNNFNRIEENINIDDCLPAHRALSLLFGTPQTVLNKEEQVFWTDDGMIISIATVNDYDQLFLEIEGPTEELVLKYCTLFENVFDMKKETRSMLEIFGTVV